MIFIHGFYFIFFQSNCYYRFVFLFIVRTKTLVLELLTVVCLITGGHERVLNAFDNFKKEVGESTRFEYLIHYFFTHESESPDYNMDFMVSVITFISIY